MSGSLLRTLSSSQVSDWFSQTSGNQTIPVPSRIAGIDFLVIAGGGGGGLSGGGGGAGGYRTSVGTSGRGAIAENKFVIALSTNYTVTIGGGGTAGTTSGTDAGTGSNSVFATITSLGGGRGSSINNTLVGGVGGSGGGATSKEFPSFKGLGATGQGFDGGNNYLTTPVLTGGSGGGGGGAGANGSSGSSTVGGNGGSGLSNNITGTAVGRGGGGGGGAASPNVAGTASDGGGAGRNNRTAATAGTVNTGGGGGGGGYLLGFGAGGAGGSGLVVLRYPDTLTITVGVGLTGTTPAAANGFKYTSITAGTGTVSWA